MSILRNKRNFCEAEEGAAIVEFALIAPIFFLMIFAIVEFGLVMFSAVAIESAVIQVSRETAVGKNQGGDRIGYARQLLERKASGLINADRAIITANTVAAGGTMKPDICIYNGAPSTDCGPCNSGNGLLEEVNGVPNCQGSEDALVLGESNELVELRISYPWQVQIPFVSRLFGQNGVMMISSSTLVKNEPF